MKIKFTRVIVALIFAIAMLTAIGFSPKDKPITFAAETDYSIPTFSNQLKSYETNIPDVWYDENRLFGINVSNNLAPAIIYMDYISTDGTKNYANDEIITLTLGTPLEFYLEVGANNYDKKIAGNGFDYEIFNYSSVFALEVTVNYKGNDYIVYNDEGVNNLDFSGDLIGANQPLNLEFNSAMSGYDMETLGINSDYRLMKFTITPLKVGADVLSIGVNGLSTFYTNETIINVVDDSGDGEMLVTNAEIYTTIPIETEYAYENFNFAYFSGNLENASIALPYNLQYELPYSTIFVVDKNENDYLSNFTNVNFELTLSSTSNNFEPARDLYYSSYYFVITKTGTYEISANSRATIEYVIDETGTTKTLELSKDFVFEVVVYDQNSFIPSNFVEYDESSNSYLYPTNHALDFRISLTQENDYFTGSYTIDGDAYNGSLTLDSEQTLNVSSKVTNTVLKDFLNGFISQIIELDIEEYIDYESPSEDQISQRREELYEGLTTSLFPDYLADIAVSYNIKTEKEETLIPKAELSFGNETLDNKITIDLQNPDGIMNLSYSVPSIRIGNYDDIKDKAKVSLSSSKKGVSLDNGVITFNNVEGISSYDLTLTADYGVYGTKNSDFTVEFIDSELSVRLSETNVTMTLEEPSSVFVVLETTNDTFSSEKLDYEFVHQKGNVIVEKSDLSPFRLDLTATSEGLDSITIIVRHDGLVLSVLNLNVTIVSSIPKNDQTLNFIQGNDIKIYLSNFSNVVDLNIDVSSIVDKDYYFTWICLNNSVLEIQELSPSSARITALRQGATTLIAFCQFTDGSSVNAIANITVLTDEPTVNLTFSKSDSSSFTIYDNIQFGVNSHGFSFSNDISVSWFIDGEKLNSAFDQAGNVISLNNSSLSFYNKLSAGLHTVKVEIIDNIYGLTLSCERQISITTITDKKRTLSFEDETINLVYTSSKNDIYTTQVLLDGVINNDFEYKWIADDADILRIMSNDAAVSIEPLKSGETTLTVFCNVGIYEDNYVRAELKVCVFEIETISFIPTNNFPKPGEDIVIDVAINDKVGFKNLSLPIAITNGSDTIDYTFENGQIIIKSAKSGKYEVSVNFGELQPALSLTVTNFNMKEVITVALPYLVIIAVIAIILLVVLKARSNPYKTIQNGINKLVQKFDGAINATKNNPTNELVVKQYNSIIATLNRLIAKFSYYYDEGRDECKNLLQHSLTIKKILLALITTSDKNFQNASKTLTSIKEKQILELEQMVEEMLITLKVHDEQIAELNRQDKEEAKKNKKIKKSRLEKEEEQLKLLKNQGLIDDDGE